MVFFGNTFFQLAYSAFVAFDLFSLTGVPGLRELAFSALSAVMVVGFSLMLVGRLLDREGGERGEEATPRRERDDERDDVVDPSFARRQAEYDLPRPGEGNGQTPKFLALCVALFVATGVAGLTGPQRLFRGLYTCSVAFGMAFVACVVALLSGSVGEDLTRRYLAGYHLHESVVGLYFLLIGVPLLAWSPFYSAEFAVGSAFVTAGVFLFGRDWKDLVAGDILVHKSREGDYEEFLRYKRGKRAPKPSAEQ
ncbi:MAG: hypothetical protein Kow0069_05870 [Promethearchaeota archaeon]